ncbi:UNVERIFIED_CONTAM: hypothetical protein HDU68_004652 [Siphonaria sp. JEL0065]|nr:hypothetical protein HDU68_004652 [Siphonaria sp. JEL0065]
MPMNNAFTASGKYKIAALTNNFAPSKDYPPNPETAKATRLLRSLFDEYFESCVIGLRKPDSNIYLHVCRVLGVQPDECVFLDDIGVNLKFAKELGFTTIRVHVGKVKEALVELEKVVGVKLVDVETISKL